MVISLSNMKDLVLVGILTNSNSNKLQALKMDTTFSMRDVINLLRNMDTAGSKKRKTSSLTDSPMTSLTRSLSGLRAHSSSTPRNSISPTAGDVESPFTIKGIRPTTDRQLSADSGRGSLPVTPAECPNESFDSLCIKHQQDQQEGGTRGVSVTRSQTEPGACGEAFWSPGNSQDSGLSSSSSLATAQRRRLFDGFPLADDVTTSHPTHAVFGDDGDDNDDDGYDELDGEPTEAAKSEAINPFLGLSKGAVKMRHPAKLLPSIGETEDDASSRLVPTRPSLSDTPPSGKSRLLQRSASMMNVPTAPSFSSSTPAPGFKRPVRPEDIYSPRLSKKRRGSSSPAGLGEQKENDCSFSDDTALTSSATRQRALRRCNSELGAGTASAEACLARPQDMLDDNSRQCLLPFKITGNKNLRAIDTDTMADVVLGRYNGYIENLHIIDCRYPYEFEGGRIKEAENVVQLDQMMGYLEKPIPCRDRFKRTIFIFHCEFSSERGPSMMYKFRNADRSLNDYPNLHYPELYLLEGGYKKFYHAYPDLCVPRSYRPMDHPDFADKCRLYRKSSKVGLERSKSSSLMKRTGTNLFS